MVLGVQQLYKNEKHRFLAYVRSRVATLEDAEDILQDVFTQILRADVTQPVENLMAWAYRSLSNRIIDYYRMRKFRRTSGHKSLENWTLEDWQDQPEKVLASNEFSEAVASALEELPLNQQQAFVWHVLDGMSFQEMADRTGEPVNTWIGRKRYAVLFLRERLKDYEEC